MQQSSITDSSEERAAAAATRDNKDKVGTSNYRARRAPISVVVFVVRFQ